MQTFLHKYGTGNFTTVYIELLKAGVTDQAVSADWTPATGDVKVSKDGGAAANIGTLPTAIAMGNTAYWAFVFTDAEVTCKKLVVTVGDSATKAVQDSSFTLETFGHASALYPTDLSVASVAQTGDVYPLVDTEIATIVTAVGTTIPATLATIAGYIDTEVGTLQTDVTAVKAKTDQLTFTDVSGDKYIKSDIVALEGEVTITDSDRFDGLT